jgi:hypothetical protein
MRRTEDVNVIENVQLIETEPLNITYFTERKLFILSYNALQIVKYS